MAVLAAVTAALSAPAHASVRRAGVALARATLRDLTPPAASCPAGVPVQAITVVDQAHVRPFALARVENAVVSQSMQLRAAWGTPCVRFGPGGWPLQLLVGGVEHGAHYGYPDVSAQVWTGGLPYEQWSQDFSHEIVEELVDPSTTRGYYEGTKTIQTVSPLGDGTDTEVLTGSLEVADPVDERAYKLDGVWVSDFVFPAWFAGAPSLPCDPQGGCSLCDPPAGDPCGPPIAPAGSPGPYDEMGILTAPWDTTWELLVGNP